MTVEFLVINMQKVCYSCKVCGILDRMVKGVKIEWIFLQF